MTELVLGNWDGFRASFAMRGETPLVAGISGGRTSAMMAALLPPEAILTFQNTGREHPGTYEFLRRLDKALGGRLHWLEFRKPKRKGAPPRDMRIERVTPDTADCTGKPFRDFLEMLAEYRATKEEGPIAPWPRQRICTAYMKAKVQHYYVQRVLGIDTYDDALGLRADEPDRVHRLRGADTRSVTYRCPLSDVGITKPDVIAFWRAQSFDLSIEEYQGNCTGCFLKDQADLSRMMGEPEGDLSWWQGMADTPKLWWNPLCWVPRTRQRVTGTSRY